MKIKEKSISKSIQIVIFQALTLCLILLIVAVLTIEYFNTNKAFRQNIDNLSSLVARYSAPTLVFEDEEEALNTLKVLSIDQRIVKAEIHKLDGNILASITFNEQVQLHKTYKVQLNVVEDDVKLGQLSLWVDLSSQYMNLLKIFLILLSLCIASLLLALFLSRKLPAPITFAISNVVNIFGDIRRSKNFSKRVEHSDIREMNTIVNGLNTMLEQISKRDFELQQSKERLEIALKSSGEGIWELNPDTLILTCDYTAKMITTSVVDNSQIASINVNQQYQDAAKTWLKRIHQDERTQVFNCFISLIKAKKDHFKVECRVQCSDHSFRWVVIHGLRSYDQSGSPANLIGTIMDVHERRKAAQESELLSAIFQKTQDPVVVINSKLIIQAANAAFCNYAHFEPEGELLEKCFDSNYNERHFFERMKKSLLRDQIWDGELRFISKNGEEAPMWLSLIPVGKGDNINFLGTFSKLDKRQSIEDELRYLANYDSLTDLPNRRMFNDRLGHCLLASKRYNYNFAIIFMDVNDFKTINDTLGHQIGDEVLIAFAKYLKKPLRELDTVARLGGDEFVVLIEQCGPRHQVAKTTERLIREISKPVTIPGRKLALSSSIGIAYYPEDGTSEEELMINADLAMYRAKNNKKIPYMFFQNEWGKLAERQVKIRYALATAIENNELFITLQPKFDLNSLTIDSAEALIRWVHPEYGFISPVEFIPLAEDCGLIESIGNWVLHQVAETLHRWRTTDLSHISIAVNVSAVQFDEDKLPKELTTIINQYEFPIENLELELTESILLKSENKAVEMLNDINNMGFSMSIDDFGTGYSSLQYLSKFPVNALKIDRSFIMNFENDIRDETIIKAIVAMAQGLDMKVIAEGVETIEQLQLLAKMGANTGQGYWCSKPIKVPVFEKFIRQWRQKTSEKQFYKESTHNEQ